MSDDLIYKLDGTPFKNKHGADMRMGVLAKRGMNTEVVPVDGGFALKPVGGQREIVPGAKAIGEPPVRVPLGVPRRKLGFELREGYHRHWFNDDIPGQGVQAGADSNTVVGRINDARRGGYTHVCEADGSFAYRLAGTHKNGDPKYTYLMEIPLELYEEDQKRKREIDDATEAAIKGGRPFTGKGSASLEGSTYIPKSGISITARTGEG